MGLFSRKKNSKPASTGSGPPHLSLEKVNHYRKQEGLSPITQEERDKKFAELER